MLATLLLAQVIGLVHAIPHALPQGYHPIQYCGVDYSVNEKNQMDGPSSTAGVYCVAGKAGCTIGRSEDYSVGVTVTVGVSLGLNFESISESFDTSIAYTTTTSTTDTGTAACPPGPWACGLLVTPSLYQVSGHKGFVENGVCVDPNLPTGDYTVRFPVIDVDNNAVIRVEACTCPEQPHADAPGHPPKCPNPCNLGSH